MNEQNYNHMIDMLIKATQLKLISWEEDASRNAFVTKIHDCKIKIKSVYDIGIEESSVLLSLSNPDNVVFSTYSFSEETDKAEYDKLSLLYSVIRDVVYRISESEGMILKGLKKILDESNDGLPF